MNIVSVKDRRLKALIEKPSAREVKGLNRVLTSKLRDMIAAIYAMTHPLQLLAVPSWKAHELIPGQPGKWSLFLNGNFRLTFHVDIDKQECRLLDIEDYH